MSLHPSRYPRTGASRSVCIGKVSEYFPILQISMERRIPIRRPTARKPYGIHSDCFYVAKLKKLFGMTMPRLEKVMALFYVHQHAIKGGCAYFDTAS